MDENEIYNEADKATAPKPLPKSIKDLLFNRLLSTMYVNAGLLDANEAEGLVYELTEDAEKKSKITAMLDSVLQSKFGMLFMGLLFQWVKTQLQRLQYATEQDAQIAEMKIAVLESMKKSI